MSKSPFKILTNAPIAPVCSHFGVCGGCHYQDIPYSEQLSQKERFIKDLFDFKPLPILPSFAQWRYRNKMEFSFSEAKDGKKFLGLMQRRGKVVQLEECHLASDWFASSLKKVFAWWSGSSLHAYRPLANTGTLRTLTLREGIHTGEKMAVLTISGDDYPFLVPFLDEFTALFQEIQSVIVRKQFVKKKTPTRFEEEVLSGEDHIYETLHDGEKKWRFKIRASSFFQPNTRQAELLLTEAVKHVEGEIIFDLYCGTGTVGLFASSKAKHVIGIEIVESSVKDARDNILENGVKNVEVHCGDVEDALGKIQENPDTIIVDPPRSGLSQKTIAIMQKIQPRKIIYISCNPLTQVENCRQLGYRIASLQPVDQFPHTPHLENIAILVRE